MFTWCQVLWCDWFLVLKRKDNGRSWYVRFAVLAIGSYFSQLVKPQDLAPIWANVYVILLLVILYEVQFKRVLVYTTWLITVGMLMVSLSSVLIDIIRPWLIFINGDAAFDLGKRILETIFTACSCYILHQYNEKGINFDFAGDYGCFGKCAGMSGVC